MAVTVIVKSGSDDHSLTFDGAQRIVLGRGPGSDVRLPDPSVSHRHASVRMQGDDMVIFDEGSTNGTFVGSIRIAPHAARILRPGDLIRLGRMWVSIRREQGPATRDLASATRDIALNLVAKSMDEGGGDRTTCVRVLEGVDQGAVLPLRERERPYVIGRAPHCDLPLADPDASREHLVCILRKEGVFVRDLGAKNGTWVGESQAAAGMEVRWRPAAMVKIGRTVMGIDEPVVRKLAQIEDVSDEVLVAADPVALRAPQGAQALAQQGQSGAGGAGSSLPRADRWRGAPRGPWSVLDLVIMLTALTILMLSVAGLVWVLRG